VWLWSKAEVRTEVSTDGIRVDWGVSLLFVDLIHGQEVTGWRQMEPLLFDVNCIVMLAFGGMM
jgi:hypothetical protein